MGSSRKIRELRNVCSLVVKLEPKALLRTRTIEVSIGVETI